MYHLPIHKFVVVVLQEMSRGRLVNMVFQCPKRVVPIIGSTAEDFTMIPMLILLTAKYTTHSTWLVGLARKV